MRIVQLQPPNEVVMRAVVAILIGQGPTIVVTATEDEATAEIKEMTTEDTIAIVEMIIDGVRTLVEEINPAIDGNVVLEVAMICTKKSEDASVKL
jgi:hypothetical protein